MNFRKVTPLIIFGVCYLTCLLSQIYAEDNSTLNSCTNDLETGVGRPEGENEIRTMEE